MFWNSVIEGLKVLGHWQVWVAIGIYIIADLAFLMIFGGILNSRYGANSKVMVAGCLSQFVGGLVLQGVLMALLVLFLLPILLGGESTMPADKLLKFIWPLAKIGVVTIVIVTLLCFIPIAGQLLAQSPGIQGFLEGVIIFRILSNQIIAETLSQNGISSVSVYPGFWASVGFLLMAGILVRLVMFLVALTFGQLENENIREWTTITVGPALGLLGGIIPLFMYCSYVSNSVMNAIR